jgi:hypothetical protein
MKRLGLLAATLALVSFSGLSEAAPRGKPAKQKSHPLLECTSFEFKASGHAAKLVFGYMQLDGVGRFHCTNLETNRPVDVVADVTLGTGWRPALKAAVGYFELEGDTQMNYIGKMPNLDREFITGGSRIAWGKGLAFQNMILDDNEIKLTLKIKVIEGAGATLGFDTFRINAYKYEPYRKLLEE